MNPKNPRDLAISQFSIEVSLHNGAQWQGMAEAQQGVTTVKNRRKELPRPTDDVPVLGKQQLQEGILLVRRTSPIDRNRNEQQFIAVGARRLDKLPKSSRTRFHGPPDEKAFQRSEHDEAPGKTLTTAIERLRRRRQPVRLAGLFEGKLVRETAVFEDVTHARSGIADQFPRFLGPNLRARPERESPACKPVKRAEHDSEKIHGARV